MLGRNPETEPRCPIWPSHAGAERRLAPPIVRGAADLTDFANQGNDYDGGDGPDRTFRPSALFDAEKPPGPTTPHRLAARVPPRRGAGPAGWALEASQMFRIGGATDPLRLLALVGPGDLMVNTPLDFLTNYPERPASTCCISGRTARCRRSSPTTTSPSSPSAKPNRSPLRGCAGLFAPWPRPALNNPGSAGDGTRHAARSLADVPGLQPAPSP